MEELVEIYRTRASRRYGLTDVSQLQHALQAAMLAEQAGEPAAMIVAALFHDIGHMTHALGEHPARAGIDDRHESRGAAVLAPHFPAAVSEPVRLHVAAKRYLAAVEADYAAILSPDSIESLALQGGPMTPAEVEKFRREPYWQAAVRLRRFDEAAKDAGAATPPLDHFLRYVARAADTAGLR